MSLNRIILLTLFIGLASLLCGQTNYPAGVYMSQHEMIYKTPSEQYNLEIRTMGDGFSRRVKSPDKQVKRKIINKQVWAISDGLNLYINGYHIDFDRVYYKVEHEGKYLLFQGGMTAGEAGMVAVGGGLVGAAIAGQARWLYAWNPITLEYYRLNKPNLETWLEETPWLLSDYQMESYPKDMDVLIRYASLRNSAYDEIEGQD